MRSFLIFSLLISLSAFADEENCDTDAGKKLMAAVEKNNELPNCPNPKKIKNICMTINERTIDSSPEGNNKYMYQRKILEASCVDISKDDQKTINQKVQTMWNTFEPQLICNSVQFDTQNGNLLKYAIHSFFDDFIDDAITWKVNLNTVDKYDGMTVLDYLKSNMDRVKGQGLEKVYKIYYDRLRNAGAKHKSEL